VCDDPELLIAASVNPTIYIWPVNGSHHTPEVRRSQVIDRLSPMGLVSRLGLNFWRHGSCM
jgi:hypothetical protein